MADVVFEVTVPRSQVSDFLAVLTQIDGSGGKEEVGSIARQMSRALFEGARVCQRAKRYDQADLFYDEAEVASRILEACEH